MGEKQPRSDRWRRFWHWHGFEIVIILALAVGYAVFSFVPADVLFGHGSSSSASSGVSNSSAAASHTLTHCEEGYIDGDGHGFSDGRSDGFGAGEAAGLQNAAPSFVDDGSYADGYASGYGRAYARWWIHGYIDGYISQHPEINEYDLLDDILYTFPDVDTDDLIDYLRSAR